MLLLEKKRISSKILSEITSGEHRDIVLSKVIGQDTVIFKDITFDRLSISGSTFKSNLSFINCYFRGDLDLNTIKILGQLSFINCRFKNDLNISRLTAVDGLKITLTSILQRFNIRGINAGLIDIDEMTSKYMRILASDGSPSIKKMSITRTEVLSSLKVEGISISEDVLIDALEGALLSMSNVRIERGVSVQINNSGVGNVNIDTSVFEKNSELLVSKSIIKNFTFKQIRMKHSFMQLHRTLVSEILSIFDINYIDSDMDISTSESSTVSISGRLTSFVKSKDNNSLLFKETHSPEQRIGTLKILKSSFAKNHDYESEDKCFYLLKTEEAKTKIKASKHIYKVRDYLSYLGSRFILGWGVKISNPILSYVIFIAISSVYFYFKLNLYVYDNTVVYIGEQMHGFYASTILAILSVFSQQGEVSLTGVVPSHAFMIEFVAGIIMTTIIAGILIRKLVR